MKRLAPALLAAVLVVELVFGQWLGPNYGTLGIPRHYNRLFDVGRLYPGGGVARVTADAHGLRGDFGTPDKIRLLVMGNGTVFEQYVDDGQTLAARLGARLGEAGCPTPTAAAGLNGQSTRGMNRRFDEWYPLIPGLRPRAVLIYVGSNEDLTESQDVADTGRPPTAWKRFTQVLGNNSALARWTNAALRRLRPPRPTPVGGADEGARWAEVETPLPAPPTGAPSQVAYGLRLTELIGRVKAMGARPIVVTQHAGEYFHEDGRLFGIVRDGAASASRLEEARTQAAAAMAACRAADALCIDMVEEMMPARGDFYDHVHASPAGDRRFAEFLAPRIASALGCR